MNILVVGSGGREAEIIRQCKLSERVDRVIATPGNAWIARTTQCVDIAADDIEELRDFALAQHIDLTIVGPEVPLVAGIVDLFQEPESGLTILGPTAEAALIEGSKLYAKTLMDTYGIPTARWKAFTDVDANVVAWLAREHIKSHGVPCVIKADGLASGKGVVVAHTMDEALAGIDKIAHTQAGRTLLVEDLLEGWECSFTVLTDGEIIIPLEVAVDYKRIGDGDTGPNTGGMGSFSPVPRVTPELYARMLEIAHSTLAVLPYRGMLYIGFMITEQGLKVLEFNCRLGDPEAQVILPRLASDAVDLFYYAARGELHKAGPVVWSDEAMVAVVVAASGYPGKPETGDVIYGLDEAASHGAFVLGAGVGENVTGQLVTDGGRVICVVGHGKDHASAREMALDAAEHISFGDPDPARGTQQYRRDIALNV